MKAMEQAGRTFSEKERKLRTFKLNFSTIYLLHNSPICFANLSANKHSCEKNLIWFNDLFHFTRWDFVQLKCTLTCHWNLILLWQFLICTKIHFPFPSSFPCIPWTPINHAQVWQERTKRIKNNQSFFCWICARKTSAVENEFSCLSFGGLLHRLWLAIFSNFSGRLLQPSLLQHIVGNILICDERYAARRNYSC